MKSILHLCLFVSLLWGQQVHFSFYEHTYQKFEIPFDRTFRLYSVAYDLINIGQTPILSMVFNDCQSNIFHIDNIRFPSNAYIDFEEVLPNLTHSVGITQAVLAAHPSDSGLVLQIEFDLNHMGRDTLKIPRPDSWYPAVPDRVGLEFQSDAAVQFTKYYKPAELARYDVSVNDWSFSTILDEKINDENYDDPTIDTLKRWIFPIGEGREVTWERQIYEYSHYQSNLLNLNDVTFDFEAGLNEYVGVDSFWGSWLVDEHYEEIFNRLVFVKQITLSGLIGNALYFGYGLGFIREDFPGTSVHADLVGLQDQGEVMGDMSLPISLALGTDYDSGEFRIFPPDTNWYHYTLPVSELYRYTSMPTTSDSLLLALGPEIIVNNHDTGRLLFNGFSLWEDENLVFNYGIQDHEDWIMNSATNGSEMYWHFDQEVPPDSTGRSNLLYFANDWLGGNHFAGFAEYTVHFESPINMGDAELKFWMKQPLIMTGIDEHPAQLPAQRGVTSAYPNPFNGEVTLWVTHPDHTADGQIVIYDLKGRQIWSQEIGSTYNMVSQITWNGNNLAGQKMDSGLYIVILLIDGRGRGQIQKLVMLK